MGRLRKTLPGIWADLDRRYFDGRLAGVPPVEFRWVEHGGIGRFLDTRECEAQVTKEGRSPWLVEVNALYRRECRYLYQIVAHEAIHVLHGNIEHRSAEWNQEVRLLQGKGFFLRLF